MNLRVTQSVCFLQNVASGILIKSEGEFRVIWSLSIQVLPSDKYYGLIVPFPDEHYQPNYN